VSPAQASSIDRFLGPGAGSGGPFAVLGLDPREADETAIIRARAERMRRIESHPLANTPEADEARLALVAAAAQLLSPTIRASFSRGSTAPAPETGATLAALEHDALLMIGLSGGWNELSRRRIVLLGHARGASNTDIAAALRSISMRPSGSSALLSPPPRAPAGPVHTQAPPATTRRDNDPTDEEIDPAQRLLEQAIMLGGIGVVALLAVVLAGWWLVRAAAPTPPGVATAPGDQPIPAATARESAPTPGDPAGSSSATGLEQILSTLDRARRSASETPYESARLFGTASDQISAEWTGLTPEKTERVLRACAAYFNELPRVPGLHRAVLTQASKGVMGVQSPLDGLKRAGTSAR